MFKHKIANCAWVTVATLLLAGLGLIGCESASQDPAESTLYSVTLSVSKASLTAGESTMIEATVSKDGTPVYGAEVQFSASPGGSGVFTQTSVATDSSGKAATVFNPSEYGLISVTAQASVDGGVSTRTVTLNVSEEAQSGTGNITVSSATGLLTANGSDQATVSVNVRDGGGNPAPDGTVVRITAGEQFVDLDNNGYWSQGYDSLLTDYNNNGRWDAMGMIPSTATVSGGNGLAQVAYTAGSQAGTVYLRATVVDDTYAGYDEISLQLTPDTDVHSIYLTSDTVGLSVQATGGIETSWLRAQCYDVWGNTVPEGVVVTFSILDSPGGGEYLGTEDGAQTTTAVTNSQGIASTVIHSGTKSGTIRTRAYIGGVLSNAAQVLVSAGPPYEIVVGAEYCNVQWWNIVGEEAEVVAIVSDIYQNPVNDSTVVYFTCDEGVIKSHQNRTMDQDGRAYTLWMSGTNYDTDDGVVVIRAETAGGTVFDTSIFYNSFVLDSIIAMSVPATMPADGVTDYGTMVYGYDLNWNPVEDETKVFADAMYVKVAGTTLEDGCGIATGRSKITSATLSADYSTSYPLVADDDGIGATDVIEYFGGYASSKYNVILTTGSAYAGNSSFNTQTSTVSPGEIVTFNALIKDRFGNPLGDHTLEMSAALGSIVPGTGTRHTNPYGEATGFQWVAPMAEGEYTIQIDDTDPRGNIYLSTKVKVEIAE